MVVYDQVQYLLLLPLIISAVYVHINNFYLSFYLFIFYLFDINNNLSEGLVGFLLSRHVDFS